MKGTATEEDSKMSETGMEMPRYKCHKEVWALKIKAIARDSDKAREEQRETDGSAMITPEEDRYAPFKVDANYMHKHKPEVGGYYVVYADGYKSFSPAKAFEDGYSLDEVTQTTAERRLKQMAAKREKEAKRAATNAPRKTEAYHCGDPYCGDCPEPHTQK